MAFSFFFFFYIFLRLRAAFPFRGILSRCKSISLLAHQLLSQLGQDWFRSCHYFENIDQRQKMPMYNIQFGVRLSCTHILASDLPLTHTCQFSPAPRPRHQPTYSLTHCTQIMRMHTVFFMYVYTHNTWRNKINMSKLKNKPINNLTVVHWMVGDSHLLSKCFKIRI